MANKLVDVVGCTHMTDHDLKELWAEIKHLKDKGVWPQSCKIKEMSLNIVETFGLTLCNAQDIVSRLIVEEIAERFSKRQDN